MIELALLLGCTHLTAAVGEVNVVPRCMSSVGFLDLRRLWRDRSRLASGATALLITAIPAGSWAYDDFR